ncbi:MAG TPA: hypothetical protein DCQ26_01285 [Marinilabiliales bacterium]|nr:MAG: hypothetical protein A2W95_02895 [Bacteroidetes bacterium GWA2_40_14]OFX73011.1 MAG: hypothetical protein A2W96_19070 [Bacteroidetes bacterium GWD2_40_43]OFX92641.1 MAG: hypothetical protein A2W97_09070 [Bacteroidetes bacterium GWE2_40_63]OFY17498.1 MAG: hypothetical protein A2W88_13830 [Bacteroidetes bacterium GWF2_40_13]OFZ27568.1 MAG: hypothetical protein A2437_14970 [Bacteroidetes bacterium RIFOXYC2_FULL_40_12]HAM97221.1 hypothetical protein [Marinilabiliales bacterium]
MAFIINFKDAKVIVNNKFKSKMTFYSKYLIAVGIIGLSGIPLFILDYSDLSWNTNKESYWGMISMVALIIAVLVYHVALKREQANTNTQNRK